MAGGDGMFNRGAFSRQALVLAIFVFSMAALGAAANKARILQTNSAGDNVHVIDPATNKVVGLIQGIEVGHGVAASLDGKQIYVSNESAVTLDVFDGKTFKLIKQIPLSGRPNNITRGRDGRRVYVAIRDGAGGVDVIDTASLQNVKSIATHTAIHNPYVTPDGKYVLAGSVRSKNISVIDTGTEELAWTIPMDLGVRPMAISANPDGSTKWIFVQLDELNGFAVVDFATRKEIKRIHNPDITPGRKPVLVGADASHGMAVTPDQKTLVVCSRLNSALYSYSLPELKLLGTAELGGKGAAWVTLTPDGGRAYVANAVSNDVSAVDIKSMKEIARIPVGFVPKRNSTAMLP
jgi:YVTN family beta-propeller protein